MTPSLPPDVFLDLPPEERIGVPRAAALLGVSAPYVRDLMRRELLPLVLVGTRWFTTRAACLAFLVQCNEKQAARRVGRTVQSAAFAAAAARNRANGI